MNFERILVLGPHTDDGEFACGGTMAQFIERGCDLYYATFSCAEESVPEGLPKDILKKEVREASAVLGIDPDKLLIFGYPVRKFNHYRQEILEDLVKLNADIKPDLVLMPAVHDLHQDHSTVAQEGLRAFKRTSILGWEMPWNHMSFDTEGFVVLEERHIERKIAALKCYRSQTARDYSDPEFIRGWARTRGVQVGVKWAEAYSIKRWVIR